MRAYLLWPRALWNLHNNKPLAYAYSSLFLKHHCGLLRRSGANFD
jgi:hypothetical protein